MLPLCIQVSDGFIWLASRLADVSEGEQSLEGFLLTVGNGAVLWATSFEILDYYNGQLQNNVGDISIENTKRVVLSAFWLVYALCGLAVGILKRSIFARYLSSILFGVTIFKIFLYDTANLDDIYRFISFISLGVILLIAGYCYYRYKDRITEFVRVEKTPNV